MNKAEALSEVLRDPTRSQRDRDIASRALQAAQADSTVARVSELLQLAGKPLEQVSYHAIHSYCCERGWRETRGVFDLWLDAYFKTDNGRQDAARIAEYLRKSDLEEFDAGMRDWKASEWKSAARLIRALELIAISPARGNYHDACFVEGCQQFLAELRRRTAP